MKRAVRRRWIGLLSLGLIAVLGIVAALVVFAGTGNDQFTATAFSDVIRFEAAGVATLQVRIYDLSGKSVWDSGMVAGGSVDWDRNNERGERMAYGAYLYVAQGWETGGELSFKKNGKLALMPGDKVQLQQAPLTTQNAPTIESAADPSVSPLSITESGHIYLTGTPPHRIWMEDSGGTLRTAFSSEADDNLKYGGGAFGKIIFNNQAGWPMLIDEIGRVGIGTTSLTARLTIEGTSGDLIAAYNSSNRVFVVKSTGEVRADGTVYAAGFNTGSADVAERINVSEWVEAGNVVEIDTDHPGFFCKSTSAYSTKVAGIISTSPGVILGNNFNEETDNWEDNRPVLAVTGRVPCMVSTENGPIAIGDLLVASSTPGVAMKGDSEQATGAVVGKAMEPLQEGTGEIMAQVALR
jgi:hypothetical protein